MRIVIAEDSVLLRDGLAGLLEDDGQHQFPFAGQHGHTDTADLDAKLADRAGARPLGVAGMSVDEIVIHGIWKTRNGYVAQVRAKLGAHDVIRTVRGVGYAARQPRAGARR